MRLDKETRLIIKRALQEDIGHEDITTLFTIPYHFKTEAVIIAKEKGILCGMDIAKAVFKERDSGVFFKAFKKDGDKFRSNQKIAFIKGDARIVLSAERVALNFLSLFSGIATTTREFVDKCRGTKAKILDTRKTTPNLRVLEKYAVRIGGGFNHRKSLGEAILIKDNHLRAGRFMKDGRLDAIKMAKCISYVRTLPSVKTELEVETLHDFKAIIKYKPDIVMLDNFDVKNMRKAVKYRNKNFPQVTLEASGGVKLENVRKIAKSGVDFISIGSLTHSPKAIDFSLEITNSKA
ncbi:MAG: carboxylating nicotinate-nucleotide diphosphorylase [Candidatus Omnitrophica bacterium]|nr:carboxylating nicotinate-nucleotide diphosphorylase [Candidatus Omnitrophota bacterium]